MIQYLCNMHVASYLVTFPPSHIVALPTEVTRPHIDVEYFRRLHSEVVASLTSLCTVWEEKEEALQKQLSEEGETCDVHVTCHLSLIIF